MDQALYQNHLGILREELLVALGCTEPIAIALAAARARDLAGGIPDRLELEVSGSIVKNAKSVVVPHTGGLKGIEAAAAAGVVAGDADAWLEVIAKVDEEKIARIVEYLAKTPIEVRRADTDLDFDLVVHAYRDAAAPIPAPCASPSTTPTSSASNAMAWCCARSRSPRMARRQGVSPIGRC